MTGEHRILTALWRVAVVVLSLAIAAGAFFWISQSALLAVEDIELEGTRAISMEEVMDKAGPLLRGQSLLKPSFDDVNRALSANPYAETVEIERDFPHTVRIRIREYRPFVNLKAADSRLFIMSAEGRTLAPLAAASQDYPVLSTKYPCAVEPGVTADCQDVSTGLWFLANIPVNFNLEFAQVTVADGDITASTKSGVLIHFGSLDEYGLKFEVMRQLMARAGAAGVNISLDVSVPERPVTKDLRPTVTPPAEPVPSEPAATAAPADDTGALPAAGAAATGAPDVAPATGPETGAQMIAPDPAATTGAAATW